MLLSNIRCVADVLSVVLWYGQMGSAKFVGVGWGVAKLNTNLTQPSHHPLLSILRSTHKRLHISNQQ